MALKSEEFTPGALWLLEAMDVGHVDVRIKVKTTEGTFGDPATVTTIAWHAHIGPHEYGSAVQLRHPFDEATYDQKLAQLKTNARETVEAVLSGDTDPA